MRHRLASAAQVQVGFTLIEVLIAVAIIAILAAVAMPNYQEFIRRARRADAQSFLTEIAARQQHFLVDRRAYSTSLTAAAASGGLGMSVPSGVAPHYAFTVTADNAARPPTFAATATPTGNQTYDKCGTMTINQGGTKTAIKDEVAVSGCW